MARHVTDFKKLPLEILLDLINHDNGTSLSYDHFSLTAPQAVEGVQTSITANAVLGSGYRGQRTMSYNRIDLPVITALEEVQTLLIADVTTVQEIVDLFNTKYGLNITTDDATVNDLAFGDAFAQEDGPVVDIVVKAKPGSYVWTGECTFKLRSTAQLLRDALPITALDGLWMIREPFTDRPEGAFVATTELGEVRVTDDGAVRIFKFPAV